MQHSHSIADIQLLRAVAVLMVLAHHAQALYPSLPLTTFQSGLWAGVDLFFCISGFVIMRSLHNRLPEIRNTENNMRVCVAFWKARFWRIMPAMCVGLCVMLLNAGLLSPERVMASCFDTIAALLQVANLHFYHCTVNKMGVCGNGSIYWSLSLEFQFYLLLPLLVLGCKKKYLIPCLCTLLLVQLCIPHSHWQNLHSFIRTESFIIGVLIALHHTNPIASSLTEPTCLRPPWLRYIISAGLILFLCVAGNQYIQLIPNPIALTALLSGMLVFIASYNADYIMPPSWAKSVLLWVGNRSFSIYLLHVPLLNLFYNIMQRTHLTPENTPYYTIVSASLACAFVAYSSHINYKWIEQYFFKNTDKMKHPHQALSPHSLAHAHRTMLFIILSTKA